MTGGHSCPNIRPNEWLRSRSALNILNDGGNSGFGEAGRSQTEEVVPRVVDNGDKAETKRR
jgi:hypothetical protein